MGAPKNEEVGCGAAGSWLGGENIFGGILVGNIYVVILFGSAL